MPTPLPDRLSYLDPVLGALERLDPESLGDDNPEAMDLIESAVRKHVHGMDEDVARLTVQDDCAALQEWMQQPGVASSAGHVYGAMFGMTMFADFGDLVG
jgi:hypothetical protein